MRVSVVVPTYNEEDYIERSLRALRNVGAHEIVVVDGGSRDRTLEIAEKYADIVESSSSLDSPAKARNAGIKLSTGDLVAFIDADTVVSKSWLNAIMKCFEDEKVVGASGPAYPLEDDSLLIPPYIFVYDILVRLTLLIGRPHFLGFNCVYRRDFLERVSGFNEGVRVSEDALLSMEAIKYGELRFLKDMSVYTSARRLKTRGIAESLFYLLYNGPSVIFLNKPFNYYPRPSESRKENRRVERA
ncbi:MAG: glycosyltransferase [Candidatus Korarchaeum sp.]|jgi:glycosyltransferase involved in cell wall biosynthesis|nr:glycosyltransferase [Candidatus Korarchaeum sp.]